MTETSGELKILQTGLEKLNKELTRHESLENSLDGDCFHVSFSVFRAGFFCCIARSWHHVNS